LFKNVVQKLTAIPNFHSETAVVAFAQKSNYEKLERTINSIAAMLDVLRRPMMLIVSAQKRLE
jgi:hypothetical protein